MRVWQVDLIDSAGGEAWNYVYSRPKPKKNQVEPEIDIVTENTTIADRLKEWDRSAIELLQPDATDFLSLLSFATPILALGMMALAIAERWWGWAFPGALRSVDDLCRAYAHGGGDVWWTREELRAALAAEIRR